MIGLTGGIATGKSTVVKIFEELGAGIVDSDLIAREIVEPGKPAYSEIVEYFGKNILAPDGKIDREKLGEIVFNDNEKRQALNGMTHPRVFEEMQNQIKSFAEKDVEVVLCDVPLLIESGGQDWLKPIILVYASPENQLDRLMERDKCSRQRALSRISSQMSIDEKRKHADIIIDNSGTVENTRAQTLDIWKKLTERK